MNILRNILKVIYRNYRWLLIAPILVAILAFVLTLKTTKLYQSTTTIYTGIVSGYSIESGSETKMDFNMANNAMDNLINVIQSTGTLEKVSIRLLIQSLAHGNPLKDTEYISATNYQLLRKSVPQEVIALIDTTSEEISIERLLNYKRQNSSNYLYQLQMWDDPFFSLKALRQINSRRVNSSDMLQLTYECPDPGIAYRTLVLVTEEFIKEYKRIQFGETDNVIAYYMKELAEKSRLLRLHEDSLIRYNVENRVINYEEQTKQMAIQSRDYNLEHSEAVNRINASRNLIASLEIKMQSNRELFRNNNDFLRKVNEAAQMTHNLTLFESILEGKKDTIHPKVTQYRKATKAKNDSIENMISKLAGDKYTKEGLSADNVVKEWFEEQINLARAEAMLEALEMRKKDLDNDYSKYSPVGAILKRKERAINLLENSYLVAQNGLNTALNRQQYLQTATSSISIVTPPAYPLSASPSKRKIIVAGAFVGTFFFLLFFFIVTDLINRTLYSKAKAEQLIGATVLGGFIGPKQKYPKEQTQIQKICSDYLYQAVFPYLKPNQQNLINLVSMEEQTGNSFIAEQLLRELQQRGVQCVRIPSEKITSENPLNYTERLDQILRSTEEKVVLIDHPALYGHPIDRNTLLKGSLNLLVARADRVWSNRDRLLFERISHSMDTTQWGVYLNYLSRESLEEFVGMLPPYTRLRKLLYRLFQLEF